MSTYWTDKLKEVGRTTGKLAAGAPSTMKAFGGLVGAVTQNGALDKKPRN